MVREYIGSHTTWPLRIIHSDYLFKVVVVGNAAAGKTCMLQRFADNKFDCSQMPTIGVDFVSGAKNGRASNFKLSESS